MANRRSWVVGLGVLCGALAPAAAAQTPSPARLAAPDTVLDAAALAAKIDEHVAARWADQKATPARPADDAEFLRRPPSTSPAASRATTRCATFSTTGGPTSGSARSRRCWRARRTAAITPGTSPTS